VLTHASRVRETLLASVNSVNNLRIILGTFENRSVSRSESRTSKNAVTPGPKVRRLFHANTRLTV